MGCSTPHSLPDAPSLSALGFNVLNPFALSPRVPSKQKHEKIQMFQVLLFSKNAINV